MPALPTTTERQNKAGITTKYRFFTSSACVLQRLWTRVCWLSVGPTGFWISPPANVSVEMDSLRTAAIQAGNWTTTPVRRAEALKKIFTSLLLFERELITKVLFVHKSGKKKKTPIFCYVFSLFFTYFTLA